MSFSVQVPAALGSALEWSGCDLNTRVRAAPQPGAAALLDACWPTCCASTASRPSWRWPGAKPSSTSRSATSWPQHRFCDAFRDWYFLPMIGCIWSCPTDQMLRFPIATMIRFCHNHGLIQVDEPAAVVHGARRRAPLRREDAARDPRRAPEHAGAQRAPPAVGDRPGRRAGQHRRRHRTVRRGRAGLPQRPVAGAAGRPDAGRDARCSARSATTATAPCCTPTPPCCRSAAAPGRPGTTNARPKTRASRPPCACTT